MKIVITGASGLIGSVLAEKLSEQDHSLVLLSRKPPEKPALEKERGSYGSRDTLASGRECRLRS